MSRKYVGSVKARDGMSLRGDTLTRMIYCEASSGLKKRLNDFGFTLTVTESVRQLDSPKREHVTLPNISLSPSSSLTRKISPPPRRVSYSVLLVPNRMVVARTSCTDNVENSNDTAFATTLDVILSMKGIVDPQA